MTDAEKTHTFSKVEEVKDYCNDQRNSRIKYLFQLCCKIII